ncbi:apolipoprotein N-acyltransferase [Leucobacter triazinivorans]|uniref:Apolipoprotein N-acyltransferase n=1 Tax=Leucobacter triazinivorans TaxID=1784719 RepID=A0A4P6KBF5_9MICO|nr:apolipoprotein N-acyltransferase [Leucobacter triazinivorans]QBE47616.1 apolipoprotein N-acyltransferase [Leucobacter triazinivorans]
MGSDVAAARPGTVARLPWWAALACAAAGGLLLDTASPVLAWWWAALPGAALIIAGVWQQRWRTGLAVGAVAGAAFWGPHISWLTLYLGPIPWLALCAVMTLWFALFGLAAAVTTRGLAHLAAEAPRARRALPFVQALAVAGLWAVREGVQGAWPYGGFPWGRLVHTQSDGPLQEAVSWLGFSGFSGLLALACALPIAVAGALRPRRRLIVGAVASSAALVLLLALIPPAPLERAGTLRIAAIQGNSKSGIFDDRESGSVIDDHIAATSQLLDRLEAEGEAVDLIVWPENSAEFDLPGSPLNGYRVARLAERAGAPVVVGSVLPNDDGSYTNSSLVWGEAGEMPGRYDKRYPVPFAEYMPNRDFFHALVPDLVDLVQLEYTAGTRPAAYDIDTTGGAVRAGIAICFDIIFDSQAVAMMGDGAELILAQTNNADFGRTDESAQQLAIARLRAIETGRSLVNISTVGTSAVVAPDGSDLDRLVPHTAGAMVAEVPRTLGETPALRFGATIAAGWMVIGGLGLALGAVGALRARRAARNGD